MEHRNRELDRRLPGVVLTALLLVAVAVFLGMLAATRLLPGRFLVLIAAPCLLLTVLVYLLCQDVRQFRWFLGGAILAVVAAGVLILIGLRALQGARTLEDITTVPQTAKADVGVYVKLDDPAQSVQDAADYTFGILAGQDRENTDAALADLAEILGQPISTRAYAGLGELIDSLLVTGETEAILVNSAFLPLLEDMEGYETAGEQLRELHVQQVETAVEAPVEQEEAPVESLAPEEMVSEAEIVVPEEPENDHVFSVYISGIDSRSGLIDKSRSDVNIIATVNTETKQVLLVSTPRDYYVPLSIAGGAYDKLTHAGIYGVNVSMDTLGMLYQTDLDYYFRVNFSGFEKIIDALGGISVYSEYSFTTYDDTHSFVKGDNWMNGSAALSFARERKAFASGDRQRGKNQMAVIHGVIDKCLSPALLTNYSSILQSVSGCFEGSMPYEVLAELVREQLDSGSSWNVVTYSVTGSGASRKVYSAGTNAYVMVPDYDSVNHAIALMDQVKNGEIPVQE